MDLFRERLTIVVQQVFGSGATITGRMGSRLAPGVVEFPLTVDA